MAKLVGLHGWARSGKDTSADFLEEVGWERRAFADPLRSLALACDPAVCYSFLKDEFVRYSHVLEDVGYDEAKKQYDEVREFLQRLGNGARVVFGDLFWVERATVNVHPDSQIVWTDVRYVNEGNAVRALGGIVVEIQRPGTGPANEFEAQHHSMPDFQFDTVIHNDGSLDDLRGQVLEIARLA